MKGMTIRFGLIAGALALVAGCNHTSATGSGLSRDLTIAGFTMTVPVEAEISRTVRPLLEMPAGISPSETWRSRSIYPGATVIRMPDRRGTLVFFDPDSDGAHQPSYCLCETAQPMIRGCPREGFYNGLQSTEMLSEGPSGHYHKIVHFGRAGLETPAALVGRYDDASWETRRVFDDILVSVRR